MDNNIDFPEFKHLLRSLEAGNPSIRFRLAGQPWTQFSKVVLVSEDAVLYQEDITRRIIMNLRDVIEFEIDQPHLEYLPKTLYRILRD